MKSHPVSPPALPASGEGHVVSLVRACARARPLAAQTHNDESGGAGRGGGDGALISQIGR